jgi:hypothetical protein
MRARNQSRTGALAFGEAIEIAHWRLSSCPVAFELGVKADADGRADQLDHCKFFPKAEASH